jgi:hypothetical protein
VDIRIAEVNQWGEPTAAVFDFALPLTDPTYRWVSWRRGRYEPFVVPPVGGTVTVSST